MQATRDKYDDAIDWLVEHADDPSPEEGVRNVVDFAWNYPGTDHGCLFVTCLDDCSRVTCCGCLTQVHHNSTLFGKGIPSAIVAEICADDRIPNHIREIYNLRGEELRTALAPFAEWQRRLDREIRGVVEVK